MSAPEAAHHSAAVDESPGKAPSASYPSPLAPPATLIYRPPSYVERIEWTRLFERVQPLEVELGSGDGSFLAEYACAYPERNFLGVERLLGRLRKLDRKGLRAGLSNLRLIRLEASYFLEYLLPPNCVEILHIYFPDPWPKRRHWKHRLVNERFPALASLVLKSAGIVYLRTDNSEYHAQMIRVFGASPDFMPIETPPDLCARLTDFERDFQAKGIPTLRAAYQRRPGAAESHAATR